MACTAPRSRAAAAGERLRCSERRMLRQLCDTLSRVTNKKWVIVLTSSQARRQAARVGDILILNCGDLSPLWLRLNSTGDANESYDYYHPRLPDVVLWWSVQQE